MSSVPGEVAALPESDGRWLLLNFFTRTSLGVEGSGLDALRSLERGALDAGRTWAVWDVQRFSNADGLLADPTRYVRDGSAWGEPAMLDAAALAAIFRDRFLLVDDLAAYRERFAPKTSLLDAAHFGNFHQQLGQELMLVRREAPEQWWLDQKFEPGLGELRNNLYRAVQGHALGEYFARRFAPGDTIVDIGCGPGYFTNAMARLGASVTGLDPNPAYIELARAQAPPGATFEVAALGTPGALDGVPDGSADYVFMSDALLFYFVPPGPGPAPDLGVLLEDVRRILRPRGTFVSVEPHYVFWLQPWLGDVEAPYTVLTEYSRKTFGVTPTPGELVRALARGGFGVVWMEELAPDPAFEEVDPRAFHFARQFPLWQLYELRALA